MLSLSTLQHDLLLQPLIRGACRVFEPRYRRLVLCCQQTNGCFALASYGVGITAMFDRVVHQDDDSSNSVTIRGGRRFLVQEGSAKVVPGTFGLTVVEPSYIYVSLCNFYTLSSVLVVTLNTVHLLALVLLPCLTVKCTKTMIPARV